jgi:hypothetical protein
VVWAGEGRDGRAPRPKKAISQCAGLLTAYKKSQRCACESRKKRKYSF